MIPQLFNFLAIPAAAILLFLAKKILFRVLRKWASRTEGDWDDFLVESLSRPVTIFIFSLVVGMIPLFITLPEKAAHLALLVAKLSAVLALALFTEKILLYLYNRYVGHRESLKSHGGILRLLVSILVYAVFFLIFLDTAGISITPLIASLGVSSIAVALALQDTLSNLFSGIYIMVDKPIRVGDFVRIESGEEGYVESIGWRTARIRLLADNLLVVPNGKLAQSILLNYHLPSPELAMPVELGVDYSSDLEKVERVTVEVAREVMKSVKGAIPSWEPFVRFHTFADSSINFLVMLRVSDFTMRAPVVHDFIKQLHRRYQQEGISIPFPVRTVYLKKEV